MVMSAQAITSASALKYEVEKIRNVLNRPETEDSWEVISKAILALSKFCQNGACDWPEELIPAIRSLSRPLISAMNSERTRLSGAAIDLVSSVALGLGMAFEPLIHIFFPVLLTLSGRTNKVIVTRAKTCAISVIESTQLPSILPYLVQSIKDKSTSLRLMAADGTLTCMNCFNPPDLEKDARAHDIEDIIRATAVDANADVRKVGRKIFEAYKVLLPGRVESFAAPLTPTIKKYLDIKTSDVRSRSPIASLAASLAVKDKLSASISTLPSSRAPSGPSRVQSIHSRSVSSSAIPHEDQTKHTKLEAPIKPIQPVRPLPSGSKPDMPPPDFVPVRPIISSSTHATRPGASADPRKRTVSTIKAGDGLKSVKSDDLDIPRGYPTRPTSASSLSTGSQHSQPRSTHQRDAAAPVHSGPRRVPILEQKSDAKKGAKHTSVASTSATSTTKSAPAPSNPMSIVKSAARAMQPESDGASAAKVAESKVGKRLVKTGGVTQPTLSQLARMKPAVQRKVPTSNASTWGRPTTKKAVPKKTGGTPSVAADARPTTPALVPLPPSPKPSLQNDDDYRSLPSRASPPVPVDAGEAEPKETDITGDQQLDIAVEESPLLEAEQNPPETEGTRKEADDVGRPRTPTLPIPKVDIIAETPISALLSSIQRGFMFTPASPLSPPDSYNSQKVLSERSNGLTIPFPIHAEDSNKSFMFGLGRGEVERHAFSSVENLDIHP